MESWQGDSMAIDFSKRATTVEIMDDLTCQGPVVFQTLRELDFINQWLGGNAVTIQALKSAWQTFPASQEITIGDLGCGSGEMLRIIHRLAKKENRKVRLIGFDANPNIVSYARDHSKGYESIEFHPIDIFSEKFREQHFDIVLATLFIHHFSEDQLVSVFSNLKRQVRQAIIVNDIHRHPLAYYSIQSLTRLFSRSAMVKIDAPLSVLRAFRKQELEIILKEANLNSFRLRWKWAFRWQLLIPTTVA